MNDLSWLLYWADVLPALARSIRGIAVAVLVLSSILTVFLISLIDEGRIHVMRRFFWAVSIAILGILTTAMIPSKQTFYLIAGSEVGGQALQTPELAKVRTVINNWLDKAAQNPKPARKDDHS